MAKKFESLNPVTGEVAGTYPIASEKDVYAAVTLATDAAQRWVELGHKGRRKILLAYSPVSYTHLTLPTNREV